MPKISVIMPAYNSEKYIAEAVESVLNQTWRDFELIIVDDGSTDRTAEIIEKYGNRNEDIPIKIIHHPDNQGVSAAKNSGIAISGGEYLVFTAADDVQEPERLEIPLQFLKQNPMIDMAFIDCLMVDAENHSLNRHKGYPEGMTSENAILFQLKRNHLWSGLVMLRKTPDVWFDTSLPNAVDYELFLRLLLAGYRLAIIDKPLMRYRLHDSNISGNRKVSGHSVERILRRLDFQQLYNDLKNRFSEGESRLAIAGAALAANLPQAAVEYLEGIALHPEPQEMERIFILGVCYYKLGCYPESCANFEAAAQLEPEDPAVLNNLGVSTILTNGDKSEVRKYFEKALSLRDGYLDAIYNLGYLNNNDIKSLKITERQLRPNLIHVEHYKI